jgi:lysozyme family protein
VACVVLDYGVNSGISRASKALQKACGIENGDGIIGPHTLNAVWVTVEKRRRVLLLMKLLVSAKNLLEAYLSTILSAEAGSVALMRHEPRQWS